MSGPVMCKKISFFLRLSTIHESQRLKTLACVVVVAFPEHFVTVRNRNESSDLKQNLELSDWMFLAALLCAI